MSQWQYRAKIGLNCSLMLLGLFGVVAGVYANTREIIRVFVEGDVYGLPKVVLNDTATTTVLPAFSLPYWTAKLETASWLFKEVINNKVTALRKSMESLGNKHYASQKSVTLNIVPQQLYYLGGAGAALKRFLILERFLFVQLFIKERNWVYRSSHRFK